MSRDEAEMTPENRANAVLKDEFDDHEHDRRAV
jgi:hypothetical protein